MQTPIGFWNVAEYSRQDVYGVLEDFWKMNQYNIMWARF